MGFFSKILGNKDDGNPPQKIRAQFRNAKYFNNGIAYYKKAIEKSKEVDVEIIKEKGVLTGFDF